MRNPPPIVFLSSSPDNHPLLLSLPCTNALFPALRLWQPDPVCFLVWMPPPARLRSDAHARLPFHKDRSSPCWLSDSHTWNTLFTLGSSKPPSQDVFCTQLRLCHLVPDVPTPLISSLWVVSLVHKGLWLSMPMHARNSNALWYARPLLQQDSSASLGPDSTCQYTSLHRDASSPLCGSDPYTPSSRWHPPCLSQAQAQAAVLFRCLPRSAQTPAPSSRPLWLAHPCTRFQVWRSTFLCPNGFRATFFKKRKGGEEKDPIVPFETNFSYLVGFFAFSFPKLSFSLPLLWANFYP